MLNEIIYQEIERIAKEKGIEISLLKEFANFVIVNQKTKTSKKKVGKTKGKKPLSMTAIKKAVLDYFHVKDTKDLRKSSEFKLATESMDLNFRQKESWETLYREFVGILPEEEGEEGVNCINGINIFKYFRPWRVFGLNPKTATEKEIKSAYRKLSKKYHPDNPETGNAQIFDRINTMYQSILPKTYQS
ncbi:DnaJ domain-containing protein [Cyanobacterium aponinum UTEX 3222]|uniref:Heat shock protein DnaJ domain protein n=2 Tax=Cyanobacterium aponinum TaxID=379064 RepID=K9Z7W4_CYAAP|nr:DnaJ domain-containing protein [Cyanobacterium aponinum]AFZ54488.1 heat shock protein DnaJ domain protein [Cyanobacterium aponinum PCC 10605]MTF40752.1 DnaJ domain-containing protein [Cyanobacterium aponinum 0216]WRL43565.1 DnaJ domain-containing protein [Cyanobacterium aponinum UTEX 3222]